MSPNLHDLQYSASVKQKNRELTTITVILVPDFYYPLLALLALLALLFQPLLRISITCGDIVLLLQFVCAFSFCGPIFCPPLAQVQTIHMA
ncbi:hypothetical protein GGI43DRAFT_274156 [Trichoderma evansii]